LDEPVTFYREDGEGQASFHLESTFSFVKNTPEWTEMQKDPVTYFERLSYIAREDINADSKGQNIRELRDLPYDRSKVKIAEFGGKKVVVKRAKDGSTKEYERSLAVEMSGVSTPSVVGVVESQGNVYTLFEFVDNTQNVNELLKRADIKNLEWHGHSMTLLDMNSHLYVDIAEGDTSPLQAGAEALCHERVVLNVLDQVSACLNTDEKFLFKYPNYFEEDLSRLRRVLLELDTFLSVPDLSGFISKEKREAIKNLTNKISPSPVDMESVLLARDGVVAGIKDKKDFHSLLRQVGDLVPRPDLHEKRSDKDDTYEPRKKLWLELKKDPDYIQLADVTEHVASFMEKKMKWERGARKLIETELFGAEVTMPYYAFIQEAVKKMQEIGIQHADIDFRNVLIRLDDNGRVLPDEHQKAQFMLIDFEI